MRNEYELSTGRKIYANGGIVGINTELEVYEGYDGIVREFTERLTPEEQDEFCDFMIALWQERKSKHLLRAAENGE
jgi:hypothetical protein